MYYQGDDAKKIRLYGDNQAVLTLAENPETFQKTKYIATKYWYLR